MPKTVPYSTVFFRHEADEVDSRFIDAQIVLHEIVHNRTLHRLPLHRSESIKWMTMRFIESIAYLDKYIYIIFFYDDIDLSSLDRIVRIDDSISFLLEITDSGELSLISCGTTRLFLLLCHCER